MQTFAPYLKPGDTIGIMCPAGAVDADRMEKMYLKLTDWGFDLKIGQSVNSRYFNFAGTDEVRKEDLQHLLDDKKVKAIIFGRGGYGCVRFIDQLDFSNFIQSPKWLVGYSDITCFLSHVYSNFNIASIHAPMSGGYSGDHFDEFSLNSIKNVLSGDTIHYTIAPHPSNRNGNGKGELVGGNLALLSDLVGTPSDINTKGKILFIEDIGEYAYNIDRMMWQLLRAGKLDHLSGLIVGGFTDTKENEIPFGKTEVEIVWEKVKDFDYPVCFDFPVGHQANNWALKIGAQYSFQVNDKEVNLQEQHLPTKEKLS